MHDGWRTYRDSDWGLQSEPDDRGEVEPLFRGKVLGGSSWMTRFAMRGSPADYDEWARLGNPGWGFEDTLEAFRRVENDLDFGAEPWHGHDGPIPVTRYPDVERSDFESALADACGASGIALIDDHNRPGAEGAARMPRNARAGARVTSADGYLPVQAMPTNVTLMAETQVAAVVVEDGEAVGVRLLDDAVVNTGWVVLCAWTYASPSILLRSGIGPPDHLRDVGVEVRSALPGVGSNLADHQGFDIGTGYSGDSRVSPRFFWLATFRSSVATSEQPPDVALWMPEPFSMGDEPAEADVTAVLLTPRSRGTVRLRSGDPTDPPAIRLPGLVHPADVDRLAQAAVRAKDVAEHRAVRRLCHDPATALPKEREELHSAVAQEAWSYPHVVGTCAMGPSPDAGAVVDARGNVHGTARLSVADASVIPIAPSGFPHLMTLMIAERMAEMLADQV